MDFQNLEYEISDLVVKQVVDIKPRCRNLVWTRIFDLINCLHLSFSWLSKIKQIYEQLFEPTIFLQDMQLILYFSLLFVCFSLGVARIFSLLCLDFVFLHACSQPE